MSRIVALLLVLGSLVVMMTHRTSVDAEEKDAPKQRKDSLGDPLPPAAVTRLGSTRFVHGGEVSRLLFSKDDKTLYSVGAGRVRVWDVATGKERTGYSIETGKLTTSAVDVSADGRFLACGSADRSILIRDLDTGKTQLQISTNGKLVRQLAFGSSTFLAWVTVDSTIHITNLLGERKTRLLKSSSEASFSSLSLSADGKWFAAIGEEGAAVLWDTGSGKRVRQYGSGQMQFRRFIGEGTVGGVLSPDGKGLFTLGSTGIVAWEIDSVEERYRLENDGGHAFAISLSGEGKTLASLHANGTIKLFEAATGKAIQTLEGKQPAQRAAFSRDGKTLAAAGMDGRIQLWNTATGKQKAVNPTEPLSLAGFTKSGREIVTASTTRIARWSLAGKEHRQLALDALVANALSPCGRYALVVPVGGSDTQLIDTEKGEVRKEFSGPKGHHADQCAFHPSGNSVAVLTAEEPNLVHFYSSASGKKTGQLQLAEKGLSSPTVLVFSADGRTLYTTHDLPEWTQRWELSSGRRRAAFRFPDSADSRDGFSQFYGIHRVVLWRGRGAAAELMSGAEFVVSPTGQSLAFKKSDLICLCDVEQGKIVKRLAGEGKGVERLAYSPDGKLLAASDADHHIRIWDVASGKLVSTLGGHRGTITSLVFSPDGKHLLTAAGDGTALLWSVAEALRLPVPQPPKRIPRSPEQAWSDLASDEAVIAELAIADLATKPDESVKLLSKHLAPAPAVERGRLDKLIQQLDHEEQSIRDEASRQLTALDEQARTVIEAATKSASVEVRRRAEAILARLNRLERTGAEARPVRAVEALERIGTPAAKKLMTEWSRGAADAKLTSEAKSALERMRE